MITFIKTWANQIIVAVIVATIFEMILPNGNNKKYIKMIIGIYVLFTIIQPIAVKITGKEIEISSLDYEKYLDEDILNTSSENFENNNSKLIHKAYIDSIENDIKAKIEQKGYNLISCNIQTQKNENESNYGTIQNISLRLEKMYKKVEETTNNIQVNKVQIEINTNTNNVNEKSSISEKEKKSIIEYLASQYSINKENIKIN